MIGLQVRFVGVLLVVLLTCDAASGADDAKDDGKKGGKEGGKNIPDAGTVFSETDSDGDGEVTPDELVDVIKENTGLDAEASKYYALIFDEDDNEKINKEEFDDLWSYVVIP